MPEPEDRCRQERWYVYVARFYALITTTARFDVERQSSAVEQPSNRSQIVVVTTALQTSYCITAF